MATSVPSRLHGYRPAVNAAARLEGLTNSLGRTALFSGGFAAMVDGSVVATAGQFTRCVGLANRSRSLPLMMRISKGRTFWTNTDSPRQIYAGPDQIRSKSNANCRQLGVSR